jgi:malonyl-CoA O-methyltransferase
MSFANIKWSPVDYKEAAVAAREAGEELLSRLDWMTLKPRVIVDMGCGTGEMSARLQARYPEAAVIALDLSMEMLQYAKHESNLSICSDAGCMPLRDQSVDLVFANFLFPWHADVKHLLKEWRRILRPDGIVMFTALGPDTLKEWRGVFANENIPIFIDMHDVGDWLLQEKFVDPIVDVNHYTLRYREQAKLYHELYASGMLFSKPDIEANENALAVTYEIIFGHAFVPAESDEVSASEDGIVRIPLSHLRRR